MKQTELKRKTPLKAKTGLKTNTGLKSKSSLKAKIGLKTKTGLKAKNGFKTNSAPKSFPESKLKSSTEKSKIKSDSAGKKTIKRNAGLQGVGRSNAHLEYHSKVVSLGCFACNSLGLTPKRRLIVHHTDGRNRGKEGDISEWLVLCLCEDHHDPSSIMGASTKGLSVHHNKKLFIKLIGTELWCVMETFKSLGIMPPWLSNSEWESYQEIESKDEKEFWLVNQK